MPVLTRLEYLTPKGWWLGHAGINLLDPQRYVERLTANGKFGRATVLADDLQPTDEVYVTPNIPEDLSTLVYRSPGDLIPGLPQQQPKSGPAATMCDFCDEVHPQPHDGGCLL